MIGYRALAIILGLICLAMAVAIFFHDSPMVIKTRDALVKPVVLEKFKNTDQEVKNYLEYILSGYSVMALGLGLLFIISAFDPLGLRPFIVVVMIGAVICIPLAVWLGTTLNIPLMWWLGDTAGCVILVVLLAVLFPRKTPARRPEDELLEE